STLLARELTLTQAVTQASDANADVDSARIRLIVRSYFNELSPRQREVFELVELRGMDAGKVAEQLGIEPSTIRVLLLRARITIRARMLAQYPDLLEDVRS